LPEHVGRITFLKARTSTGNPASPQEMKERSVPRFVKLQ
jgi:hypothetical protein